MTNELSNEILLITMSILESLKTGFDFLRRDGIFIKASILSEDTLLLETTTYITDTTMERMSTVSVFTRTSLDSADPVSARISRRVNGQKRVQTCQEVV